MKKLIKIIFTFISFIILSNVSAITPNIIYQNNIYSNRFDGNLTHYGALGYIYMNNKISYCLSPFKTIGTDYIVDNSLKEDYKDLDYFELLNYYGYNKEEHNNIYYYMATQELIWEKIIGSGKVYWTTESQTKGDRINIDAYKLEIKNLVEKSVLLPKFVLDEFRPHVFDNIGYIDYNNVLNDYEVIHNSKNNIWIENNALHIEVLDANYTKIKLIKKLQKGETTIYKEEGSQDIVSLGINKILTKEIVINPWEYTEMINLSIVDKRTGLVIPEQINFKIYDVDKSSYVSINGSEVLTTDEYGYYTSPSIQQGNYKIIPISAPDGYVFTEQNLSFKIDKNDVKHFSDITVYYEKPIGNLEIKKYVETIDKYELSKGIYEIYSKEDIYNYLENKYYKKNELIGTTDSNIELPIGNYYVKQKDSDKIYDVNISYIDDNTNIVNSKLDIYIDLIESNVIIKSFKEICDNDICSYEKNSDIEYEIYSKEDIYIDDILIYKKDELIKKFIDFDTIKIPFGLYYIKEITNIPDYSKMKDYDFIYKGEDIELIEIKKILKNKIDIDEQKEENLGEINNDIQNTSNQNIDKNFIVIEDNNLNTISSSENNKEDIINNVEKLDNLFPNTYNYLNKYYFFGVLLIVIGLFKKSK